MRILPVTAYPVVAVILLLGAPHAALGLGDGERSTDLPVTQLSGGGRAANDCLAGLEAVGYSGHASDTTVRCHDGDRACDRDGLVNGHCEFWVRVCLNQLDSHCREQGAKQVEILGSETDVDLTILGRTLEGVTLPAMDRETCAPVTTLTVPLRSRNRASSKQGRKVVLMKTTGLDGAEDADHVKFVCMPPARDRGRSRGGFDPIQTRIFEKQCAFSGCHGPTNPQAGLVLSGEGAYDALVDHPATTPAANFAGKNLVVPGAPATSFLMDKLLGALAPGEGEPMPLDRQPLADKDIQAIRKWILAGAPRKGGTGSGVSGLLDKQPRIVPPDVPAGGYQAHLPPFVLGDRPEIEGCKLVRLDNPEEVFVGKWELAMYEGSHHFILRAFDCRDRDGNGVNDCDEPDFDSRYPSDFRPCEDFGENWGLDWGFVAGAQTSQAVIDYQTAQTGVAFQLHPHQPVLLNAHYTNPYSDTIGEVWVNITPVDPTSVRHRARLLFELLANAFIKVAPGTRTDTAEYLSCAFIEDPFCTLSEEALPESEYFALIGISSHMHKRSTKFIADLERNGARFSRGADDMTDPDDGTRHLYVSTQYNDPVNMLFWPPLIVQRGEKLTYQCFHDNGINRPVRLGCEGEPGKAPGRSILDQLLSGSDPFEQSSRFVLGGASRLCRTDADCAGFGTGRCVPANLVFGWLAVDDMCVLPGIYYPCPGDPASCLQ